MKAKQVSPYPLRTSEWVRDFLQEEASLNKRSLNAQIALILEKYVEKKQKRKAA